MTLGRRRTIRLLLRVLACVVVVVVAIVCWALFWPTPDGARALECRPADGTRCQAASGRVLYVPSKDRTDRSRPLHLALISRDSTAGPLISVVKIPADLRPGETPGTGRWVSVVGSPHRGSNGETDIGVTRLLMP